MRPNPFLIRRLNVIVQRIKAERQAAAQIVPKLLRTTLRHEWHTLITHPELMNCGALERLAQAVNDELHRDASKAHQLAELAVAIADSLPETSYPAVILAQTRACAWKDLGKSFRSLGRIPESITALERADALLAELPAGAYDLALIRAHLALSFQEADRFDESLQLLARSKTVLAAHGDTDNVLNIGIAEATLLQRLHRHQEAWVILERLLRASPRYPQSLGAIHNGLAFAAVELGRYAEAHAHFEDAIRIHRELKLPLHVLRAELGIGRLLVRRGDIAEGVALLERIRRDFAEHRLIEEAGLCGLEIVEGFLRSSRIESAIATARAVLEEFTAAGLNKRAITALGYLTEAIASSSSGRAGN